MAGFSIVTSSVCSLDCVWQALGVEHVSLHSSLASHSAGSYNFSSKDHWTFFNQRISIALASQQRFRVGPQTRFGWKERICSASRISGARVLIDSAPLDDRTATVQLAPLISWPQCLSYDDLERTAVRSKKVLGGCTPESALFLKVRWNETIDFQISENY